MKKTLVMPFILVINLSAFSSNHLWRVALFSTIVTSYYTNVFALSEGSIDVAYSKKATYVKGNFLWDWKRKVLSFGNFDLNLYKQISYSKWSSKDTSKSADYSSNNALDFNMLYRLEDSVWIVEYSLGLSAMSNISLDREIDGGSFYFNHILGVGLKYKDFNFITRFQHYSNNGIVEPNCAYNFYTLNIGWRY